MRPQITAYLQLDTKKWLTKYAERLRLPSSDVVRLLVERERQVRWLEWARSVPDPGMAPSGGLPRRKDRLPKPRSNLRTVGQSRGRHR
jgi:hypothetical protein